MVPIVKGMFVPDAPDLVVVAEDGQYGDTDLIGCGLVTQPSVVACSYAAQYIRYGKVVYQYNTPEELGEALVAIDPKSTHDAAQLYREELARKLAREKGVLAPENPTAAPDAVDPTEPMPEIPAAEADEQQMILDTDPNNVVDPSVLGETVSAPEVIPTPEPLPPVPEPVASPESTSTPTVENMSSTTPAVDLSTTTPE